MTDRPWYRLHWATWLATAAVLTAVACANGVGDAFQYYEGDGLYSGRYYGWPWRGLERVTWRRFVASMPPLPGPATRTSRFRVGPICGDGAVALAMLVGSAAAVERWRRGRWRQFSLQSLLLANWTAATILLLYQARYAYSAGERGCFGGFLGVLPELHWLARVPFVFGLACTLHMIGWLAVWVSARSLQAVGQPRAFTATAPPEAVSHE